VKERVVRKPVEPFENNLQCCQIGSCRDFSKQIYKRAKYVKPSINYTEKFTKSYKKLELYVGR